MFAGLMASLLLGAACTGKGGGFGPTSSTAAVRAPTVGCARTGDGPEGVPPALSDAQLFARAHAATAVPREEFVTRLVRITKDNPMLVWRDVGGGQVKVATVMPAAIFHDRYEGDAGDDTVKGTSPAGWGKIWVTAAPQLQQFCAGIPGDADAKRRRVQQWLGMKPRADDLWVVELWVAPEALARPCPTPDITSETCSVAAVPPPNCSADDAACAERRSFAAWLDEKRQRSDGYPWTGLGYSFDWKPCDRAAPGETVSFTRFGPTEFILRPKQPYEKAAAKKLGEYCQ